MKKLIVLLNIVFCFVGGVYAQDDVFLETAKDSISAAPVVNPNILCEDTCSHVHGIDLSHYQGNVFWEAVGDNTKMAYVYLKATEGGDRIDATFERNIEMAHRHGLKVGSYHFYRPLTDQQKQLQNFMSQCLPREQDLVPMIDIESTGGLSTDVFCDSLFYFLDLVEDAYHQKPLLYTGRNFYNKHLTIVISRCGSIRQRDVSWE